ncbi:MAG: exonuclease domain-containing protein [Bauldia sp.]
MSELPERVIFVDVETTGLSADDRVVTIAAIALRTASVHQHDLDVSGLHLICAPGRPSHPRALAVHGYDDALLRHQEPFSANAAAISHFVNDGDVVVAHNASFDIAFINRELTAAGAPTIGPPVFCTMENFRALRLGSASLDSVCRHIGVQRQGERHGALEDAWLAMMAFLFEHGVHRRDPLPDGIDTSPSNLRKPDASDLPPDEIEDAVLAGVEPPLRPPPGHAQGGPPEDEEPEAGAEEFVDIDGLCVAIGYTDASGQWSVRTIRCEGARRDNGVVYLDAWCLLRNGRRSFRLDRIGSVADYRTGEDLGDPTDYVGSFVPGAWFARGDRTTGHLTLEEVGFFADGAKVLLYLAMEDGELHDAEQAVILDYALGRLRAAGRAGPYSEQGVARWIDNHVPTQRAAKLALGRLMAEPSHGAEIAHRIVDIVVADGTASEVEMKAAWGLFRSMERREQRQ